jgi:uncharacterized protein YndB with AHSA1/START domain
MTTATATENREIVSTRVFDAPRELVFRMWSSPKHVAQWWGPKGFTNTIHSMDFRPGGTWELVMHGPDGTDYLNRIVYAEIVEPERIVYDHTTGPLFRATTTFEAQGANKTAVTVRMLFETAELRNKVAEEFGAVEGLNQTLGRLAEHLTEAAVDEEFVVTRSFDAPRELVWKAWTDEQHLAKWFGPKGVPVEYGKNDLRPGGMYHYMLRLPNGGEMWGRWVYREVVPPERLVYVSSFSNKDAELAEPPFQGDWPPEMLSTVTFVERAGKTTVTLRTVPHDATHEQRKFFVTVHGSMRGGWSGTFDQLGDYLKEVRS